MDTPHRSHRRAAYAHPSERSRAQSRPRGKARAARTRPGANIQAFIARRPTERTIVPEPVITHQFSDFGLHATLIRSLEVRGYTQPTPIQDQTIAASMLGRDVVGIANTGSGKTGAFLIPLLHAALSDTAHTFVIIVPTRELAQQIEQEFTMLAHGTGFSCAVCVGGVPIDRQIKQIRRGPICVIGTPGRLKDLLARGALSLRQCTHVVLDEADRMLDMGFINDMRMILKELPSQHQTLFFSATMSSDIEKLIGEFLREPVMVTVKTGDTSRDVFQDVVHVPKGANKVDVLHDLLIKPGFDKVLIFGRTKHGVDRLGKQLTQRGFKAESIHGDKTQGKRQQALDLFRRDHVNILVATDVAARGLDIKGVSHVINYDIPNTDEDYVHRIGRTGRAGQKGIALTLIEE